MSKKRRPGLAERARVALRLGRALRLVWESAPRWTLASLALVLVQAGLPVAALWLLKLIVDAIGAAAGSADPFAGRDRIIGLIGLAAIVALAGVVLRALAAYAREAQSLLVTDHVFGVLHAKSAALDLAFYENAEYHDTLHRTQQEATTRPTMVLNSLLAITGSAATLAGILALLASTHWILVAVLVLAAIPGAWTKVRFANRTYLWMKQSAAAERQAGYFNMLLTNAWFAKEIRTWGLGGLLIARFRGVRERLRTERLRISRSRGAADVITQAVGALALFGALAYLASLTMAGAITIGALVMLYQAIQKGQGLFADTLNGFAGLYEHNLFLAHLDEFLALEPGVKAPARPAAVPSRMHEGVAFENVTFCYPGSDRYALRDVSMTVRPGEMIAIVGHNGCGKTTLIKLLCRLYDPESGRITLDGQDIRRFDPDELRTRIAVLFQDHATYAFSAKENIAFGDVRHPLDEQRVIRAATESGIDPVIRRFPFGYDTNLFKLFEGGQEISVGERQKLALARTFYSDAPVLVLDEPSSSLDPEAELELFEQIREKAEDRAAIVISHRFSTVRSAERIYVLENGEVVESGGHEALMVRGGGTYARLFEMQAAGYVDPMARVALAGEGTQ